MAVTDDGSGDLIAFSCVSKYSLMNRGFECLVGYLSNEELE